MKKFHVTMATKATAVYEVEAENQADAVRIILQGKRNPPISEEGYEFDNSSGLGSDENPELFEALKGFIPELDEMGKEIDFIPGVIDITEVRQPVDCSKWTYQECRDYIEFTTGLSARDFNESKWPSGMIDNNPWYLARHEPRRLIDEATRIMNQETNHQENGIGMIETTADALNVWLYHANLGNIGSIYDWRKYAQKLANGEPL